MAQVKSFKALRYTDTQNMKNLVTPPYDIISDSEQENFYNVDENNVIRLEYGKIFDTDTPENNRYRWAGETLKKWLHSGVLKNDTQNSFFIYEQQFDFKGT